MMKRENMTMGIIVAKVVVFFALMPLFAICAVLYFCADCMDDPRRRGHTILPFN